MDPSSGNSTVTTNKPFLCQGNTLEFLDAKEDFPDLFNSGYPRYGMSTYPNHLIMVYARVNAVVTVYCRMDFASYPMDKHE